MHELTWLSLGKKTLLESAPASKDSKEKSRSRLDTFRSLNAAVCDLVQDFSLVSFSLLNIEDEETVAHICKIIDKANGYVHQQSGLATQSTFEDDIIDKYTHVLRGGL